MFQPYLLNHLILDPDYLCIGLSARSPGIESQGHRSRSRPRSNFCHRARPFSYVFALCSRVVLTSIEDRNTVQFVVVLATPNFAGIALNAVGRDVAALSPGQGVRGSCQGRRSIRGERSSFTGTRQLQTEGNRRNRTSTNNRTVFFLAACSQLQQEIIK